MTESPARGRPFFEELGGVKFDRNALCFDAGGMGYRLEATNEPLLSYFHGGGRHKSIGSVSGGFVDGEFVRSERGSWAFINRFGQEAFVLSAAAVSQIEGALVEAAQDRVRTFAVRRGGGPGEIVVESSQFTAELFGVDDHSICTSARMTRILRRGPLEIYLDDERELEEQILDARRGISPPVRELSAAVPITSRVGVPLLIQLSGAELRLTELAPMEVSPSDSDLAVMDTVANASRGRPTAVQFTPGLDGVSILTVEMRDICRVSVRMTDDDVQRVASGLRTWARICQSWP